MVVANPVDGTDPQQIVAAEWRQELLQYRLEKSIPWFLTAIGSYQDALTVGVCASLNVWEYASKEVESEATAMIGDFEFKVKESHDEVRIDRPTVQLLPIENILFHPAAQWQDVVGTSPYLIIQLPMYLHDVLERMEREGTADEWRHLSEEKIRSAVIQKDNPVRGARDSFQEDPQKTKSALNEFDMVMVHLNFIKVEDECYAYWTLQDRYLLSDPKPVSEVFLHCKDGRPPVTVGFCVLETHKAVKSSAIHLGSELQREANEIANQRGDNVKFVLNKRWKVRRGANVDIEGIVRNVPGGVSMVNDVDKDLQPIEWQDVTQSAYLEQDRLNYDYDSVTGGMDSSSMMPNAMQEQPVGSLKTLTKGADSITEYQLKTWVMSWVIPTLVMIDKMEMAYETDEVIMAVCGKAAKIQQFGDSHLYDRLLAQDLTITFDTGNGITDPQSRMQRFMAALGAYGQVVQQGSPDMNLPKVRDTLFTLAGFKDNGKFFTQVDPRLSQAQALVQQAQGIAKQIVDNAKDRILRREMQLRTGEANLKIQQLQGGGDLAKTQHEMALKQQAQVFDLHAKAADTTQQMGLDRQKAANDMQLQREQADLDAMLKHFEAAVDAEVKMMLAHADAQAKRMQPKPQKPTREAA